MKTLELEQITALQAQHEALVQTARASARLANLIRGCIRGRNETTDPCGAIRNTLDSHLSTAGFGPGTE